MPTEPSLTQIQHRLALHCPANNEQVRFRASVILPLVERRGVPSLLLTRRSTQLRSFSGHVSFPGGKRDPEDESDYATALREASEEVGLTEAQIQCWGQLEQILSPQGCLVSPYVVRIPDGFQPRINEAEIESYFWVPLTFFLNPAHHQLRQHPDRRPYPHYTHHFHFRGYHIWGMTALLILRLLEVGLFHRSPHPLHHPQEPHWIEIAQNFREPCVKPSVA